MHIVFRGKFPLDCETLRSGAAARITAGEGGQTVGFWLFMLFTDLLVPVIMIGFGGYFSNRAPKEVNGLFGYRTPRSMKNQETWQFAHHYSGKLMFRWGWVLLPLSVAALLPFWGQSEDAVGMAGAVICCVQIVPLLGVIAVTERALKRNFDDDGNRK